MKEPLFKWANDANHPHYPSNYSGPEVYIAQSEPARRRRSSSSGRYTSDLASIPEEGQGKSGETSHEQCSRKLEKAYLEKFRAQIMYKKVSSENRALCEERDHVRREYRRVVLDLDHLNREKLRLQEQHGQNLKKHNKLSDSWMVFFRNVIQPYVEDGRSDLSAAEKNDLRAICERIRKDNDEVGQLRMRVYSLQTELLSTVEKAQALSDEQLTQDFKSLAAAIKMLSRTIPAYYLDKMTNEFENYALIHGVPEEQWSSSRSRKNGQVEAAIWSVLLTSVFKDPFYAFGDYGNAFSKMWIRMFGKSLHHLLWPCPSEASEAWRSTTVRQLLHQSGKGPTAPGQDKTSQRVPDIVQSIKAAKENVHSQVHRALARLYPDARSHQCLPVIEKTFEFAFGVFSQRSRIQILYPDIGDEYVAGTTMEMVGTAYTEQIKHGIVLFTLNPGLVKWGNIYGHDLDQRLSLVPAVVCLGELPRQPRVEAEVESDVEDDRRATQARTIQTTVTRGDRLRE